MWYFLCHYLAEHLKICLICLHKSPFIFLLDMTELVSSPLQLCLQALNANHGLQQVLVEISILLLQRPEHRDGGGEDSLTP